MIFSYKVFFLILLITVPIVAKAQKGYNELQIAGQISFPTGELAEVAERGHGFSAKGMWGIGNAPQQLTTEIGYSFFDIKDKWLVPNVKGSYGGFTFYGGYRYRYHHFFVEPQAGIAFYEIDAFSTVNANGVQQSTTHFNWAIGAGYNLGHIDLAVRYQNAVAPDSNGISFLGLSLGYRFTLSDPSKKRKL